ncbi:glycoside hydrolase superfamily, partial [Haematococcus lacustris]
AGAAGVRLLLTLGNLWPAYVGPELFLWAAGESGDVLSFYSSPKARALYKQHITSVTSRVNSLTGVAYKDDPTIMGWDVMNEPRCPGCDSPTNKAFHTSWLQEMSGHAIAAAPKQLIMLGSEGFFGRDDPQLYNNPGEAGSACEGDAWREESSLSALHVTTMHVYWRQTEGLSSQGWRRMNFEEYFAWFSIYVDLHIQGSAAMGKPILLQEFNILSWKFSDQQRADLFQLAFDKLAASRSSGGALAGVMFWSAALQGVPDDGYNVYIDQQLAGGPAPSQVQAASGPDATAGRKLLQQAEAGQQHDPALALPLPLVQVGLPAGSQADPGPSRQLQQLGGGGRSLLEDTLDGFRRGPWRWSCADAAAATWKPAYEPLPTDQAAPFLSRVAGQSTLQVVVAAARQY